MGDRLKDIATRFMQLAATGRVHEMVGDGIASGFRHHNPHFTGDGETLFAAMAQNAKDHPDKRIEIQRVLGDGNLVAVHSKVTHGPQDRGFATVHIFRFEDGRIAELWDLAQAVPEGSSNQYGMF